MNVRTVIGGFAAVAVTWSLGVATPSAQREAGTTSPPVATFKSSVDLVRVSAVVRDKRGRFVHDLSAHDFEVVDANQPRTISDFRREAGAVSVAILFDVSGSMEARMGQAREAGNHMLGWLNGAQDEVAIFTFDTRLVELTAFTTGLQQLPSGLSTMTPFGATSLHDAIARTAEKVSKREGLRRAVVVFTDGQDTASKLTASEVSGIASSIDVPVYIVGLVPSIDDPSSELAGSVAEASALAGSLNDLATWTGGGTFIVSTIVQRSTTARRIVEELRHLYLIAFEASGAPGWHPLVVRARNRDLTVRARSGYIAGQSRPISD
ncbi:MAG: VWA domain-containing protein [Luteitalea sp.]|nr:VWA domain-containing protein [Luteitalea sp.]